MVRREMSGFCVVAATADDIAAIAAVERLSAENPWSDRQLAEELEYDFAFLATVKRDEEVCGFADFHIVSDDCHLNELAVAPKHRKSGAGSALMDYMENEAGRARCRAITLEVRSGNAPARALYEKRGYETVGTRKNFYQNPCDDAVVMERRL